jgi:hypothetical protein
MLSIAISDDLKNLYYYINKVDVDRQDISFKSLTSESGFYYFAVDDNGETVEVEDEEWYGSMNTIREENIIRGYLIDVIFPKETTFKDLQDFVKSHFENILQTELLKSK